jgi:hypothetical protein
MNAYDITIQAPMSLGIVIMATADTEPEQWEAFIEHLAILGQKATPQTQEYLTRPMHTQVCHEALCILRKKGVL